jgi:hypothetical protein
MNKVNKCKNQISKIKMKDKKSKRIISHLALLAPRLKRSFMLLGVFCILVFAFFIFNFILKPRLELDFDLGALIANFIFRPQTEPGPDLSAFAQCLTDQGALMYGTYWCPLCSRQKAVFGNAWQFIGYVECTEDPQRCIRAGVQGYPTWVLQDGSKLVGMQLLESLAQASGCALPEG